MTPILPNLQAAVRHAADAARVLPWAYCSRCERATPWQPSPYAGTLRCTRCGQAARNA